MLGLRDLFLDTFLAIFLKFISGLRSLDMLLMVLLLVVLILIRLLDTTSLLLLLNTLTAMYSREVNHNSKG